MLSIALGYLFACCSVGLLSAVYFSYPWDIDPVTLEVAILAPFLTTPFVIVLALPGFLIVRFILSLARLRDPFSFAFFGALLGYGMVSLVAFDSWELYLAYPPNPMIAVVGAVAGAVACLTERWYLGRVSSLLPNIHPEPPSEA